MLPKQDFYEDLLLSEKPILIEMSQSPQEKLLIPSIVNQSQQEKSVKQEMFDILQNKSEVLIEVANTLSFDNTFKSFSIHKASIPKSSIILTAKAAKEFRCAFKQNSQQDPFSLALSLYYNKYYTNKSAYIVNNQQLAQDILVAIKCDQINSKLEDYYQKERDKYKEFTKNKPTDFNDKLFCRYKEGKLTLIGQNLRHGLFTADFLYSPTKSSTLLTNLKDSCKDFLSCLKHLREHYLKYAIQNQDITLNHPHSEPRLISRIPKWELKNQEIDKIVNKKEKRKLELSF